MNKYIFVVFCVAFFPKCVHPSGYLHDDLDSEEQAEQCEFNCKDKYIKEILIEQDEICLDEEEESLTFIFNNKTDVHVTVNETSGAVAALDFVRKITVLHDLNTGHSFVFNYKLGKNFFIQDASNITRGDSNINLGKHFKRLPSPRELYENARRYGVPFASTSAPKGVAEEVHDILQSLNKETSDAPHCDSLDAILKTHIATSAYYLSTLDGFSEVMSSAQTPIVGDLNWLLNFYQGLAYFLVDVEEAMDTLLDREVELDLEQLLKQTNGFQVLSYIISKFVKYFDVGIVLGHHLNSEDRIIGLVDKFGGQMGNSFDDYLHVLAVIMRFVHREIPMKQAEGVLMAYCSSPRTSRAIVERNWKTGVEDVLETIDDLGLGSNLPFLRIFLEEVSGDGWIYGNVSMTRISEMVMDLEAPCNKVAVAEILDLVQYAERGSEW